MKILAALVVALAPALVLAQSVPQAEQFDVATLKPQYPHRLFAMDSYGNTGVNIINGDDLSVERPEVLDRQTDIEGRFAADEIGVFDPEFDVARCPRGGKDRRAPTAVGAGLDVIIQTWGEILDFCSGGVKRFVVAIVAIRN